jgi:hypothetical protein
VIRNADSNPPARPRGTLDVVVERRDPIAILLQQPKCILAREVLELNHHARKELAGCDHELFDQLVVLLATHPRLWSPI